MSYWSQHAHARCRSRRIPREAVEAAIEFGQRVCRRGAVFYTLGWRQIHTEARHGLDLSRYEGIQVVVGHDGTIVTAYRHRLPRALRGRSAPHGGDRVT